MQTTCSHTRQSTVCCSIRTKKVIRFLSLIRIIITIVLAILSLALHEDTQHDMHEGRKHHLIEAYDNRPSVGKEASPHLYYLYFKAKQYEAYQAYYLYQFFVDLIVIGCHIFVTSLLWAGAYANKKKCLPIYLLLETILLIILSIRLVPWLVKGGIIRNSDRLVASAGLFGMFLVYLIFVPLVVIRYYCDLRARDAGRKEAIVGKKADVENATSE